MPGIPNLLTNTRLAAELGIGGGISLANLTFKAAQWREHIIQDTSDVLPAHYCDNCGAVIIETTRRGLSTLEA